MLKLNDMLYSVEIKSLWSSRKRIEYTDAEGLVWHRYSSPSWSYSIKALRIVGRSVVTTTWIDKPLEVDIPEDTYYVENGDSVDQSDIDAGYDWYSSAALAGARIAAHKESVNEL